MNVFPRRALLLVSDDPYARVLMKVALQTNGFEVHVSASGAEASLQAQRHAPGLILIDVQDNAGLATGTLRRLKADPACAAIAVVMLADAGHPLCDAIHREHGALHTVHKPVTLLRLGLEVGRLWDHAMLL